MTWISSKYLPVKKSSDKDIAAGKVRGGKNERVPVGNSVDEGR
jgi:hypothetical protein